MVQEKRVLYILTFLCIEIGLKEITRRFNEQSEIELWSIIDVYQCIQQCWVILKVARGKKGMATLTWIDTHTKGSYSYNLQELSRAANDRTFWRSLIHRLKSCSYS